MYSVLQPGNNACMYVCMYVCVYIYIYMYVCMLCMYVCTYIHTYIVYVRTCIHTYILYAYKFLRDVIFEVFVVNWSSAKFSSLKFYWQNFYLHWLERIHLNGYVWHLQEMKACFDLIGCSCQGSLKCGHHMYTNCTFQSILYGPNSGLWYSIFYSWG